MTRTAAALLICLCALTAGTGPAESDRGAPKPTLIRQAPAALPPRASPAQVETVLTAATWSQPNPRKKTSLWESKSYAFRGGGEVEITTHYSDGPRRTVARWRIERAGPTPRVAVEGIRYRLVACPRTEPATLCLL